MKKSYGLLLALLLAAFGFAAQSAQAKEDIDPKKLPTLLGSSNAGTDFWFSFPVCWPQGGGTNALKIYVSSGVAVKCTLEVPGYGIFMVKVTKPNDIIDFTLFPAQGQPYEKMDDPNSARTEQETYLEGKGKGIHVTAPAPIIVYGVSRFVYTSDSFLALPTSALGKEYIVGSYADVTGAYPGQHLMSQTVIVAPYNNTVVSFKLGGAFSTQTVGGMKIGQSRSWTLNKGDIIAFGNKKINGIYGDLSGSKITANKPVAVTSGNQCAYIPVDRGYCDFLMEMELPTSTWGKEYHVTRFIRRANYSFIKIFAKEPNTKLYRDGSTTPFYVLQTAGGTRGTGFYEDRIMVDGTTPRPIIIRGDKPISVVQFNSGQTDDNVESDPFQLNLTPIEQYQNEIIFCTPGIKGGQGFKQNYVNLVFEGNADGSMPDDLEFAVVDNGKYKWEKIKDRFGATAEPFKGFPEDTKKFFAKIITLNEDGVYKIRSVKPFAAYAYGFDSYDSYGHPTSVALGNLEIKDPDTPIPTYSQECNGNVMDGKIRDLPNAKTDTTDRSNLSIITLIEGSFNYRLEQSDFVAGEDQEATWKLYVEDPTQDAVANVYFSDRAGNDTTITISYTAPATKIDGTSLDYGLLKTGNSKTMNFVVRNTSTTTVQVIKKLTFTSSGTEVGGNGFTFVTVPVVPDTLDPLESKSYPIQFSSAVEGDDFKDSVVVEMNDCERLGAELKGRVGEPLINVSDADFGTSKVGTTVQRQITVKNTGRVPLTITGYSSPTQAEFKLTNWDTEVTLPLVLAAADPANPAQNQKTLTITFMSATEGTFTDQIIFSSDTKKDGADSVAELKAKTTEGNLIVRGYDWGRKRINNGYPGTIQIENVGTAEVTIQSASMLATGQNPAAFEIAPISARTVKGGEIIELDVTFRPILTGPHAGVYQFILDGGKTLEADLSGIGIVPEIGITEVMNFGTTLVNAPTANERTIKLWAKKLDNLDADNTISDSLIITGLTINPNGSISTTLGTPGTEGFSFDRNAIFKGNAQIVLQPGDTIEFPAEFIAQRAGGATGSIIPVSDARNTVQSDWTGNGATEGINPTSTTTTLCVGSDGVITINIENINSTPATITGVQITGQSANTTFEALTPENITVAPNSTGSITYRVSASTVGTHTATAVISSSVGERSVPVTFTTVDYSRMASMPTTHTTEVGGTVETAITMNAGANFTLAAVSRLEVEMSYDEKLVQLDKESIRTTIPGFTVTNAEVDPKTGIATFTLESTTGAVLPQNGEVTLATMTFTAYLNGERVDATDLVYTITVPGTECLRIESEPGKITVNPVCGGDVRRINISGTQYQLQGITPNPVTTGETAEINFSVGLQTYTTIEVYNSMGTMVGTLVNQKLEPGTYAVPLYTQQMSSGVYFYRIISGPFSETKELIINK